jgi:hypothetical protein
MSLSLSLAGMVLLSAQAAFAQSYSVYAFPSPAGGAMPTALVAHNGAVYGGTDFGGAAGAGVIYQLMPPSAGPWSETVLHNLDQGLGVETAGLTVAQNGVVYAIAGAGGNGPCSALPSGCGTVFELRPPSGGSGSWQAGLLHAFQAGTDGAFPTSLLQANDSLFGTTDNGGGSPACPYGGCGTVFQLTPPTTDGPWTETILYAFQGGADGGSPTSLTSIAGVLYGITGYNSDTVFQLTPPAAPGSTWTFKTIYTFTAGTGFPTSLTAGPDGALYGTANLAVNSNGSVFQLAPATEDTWTLSIIYDFMGGADGNTPNALIPGHGGNLYAPL